MLDKVRDKIAECAEKAYDRLPLSHVPSMMMLADRMQLEQYIADHEKTWSIQNDYLYFNQPSTYSTVVPSHRLIRETLTYATELERIV